MEAYGVVYRPQPSVSGAGIDDLFTSFKPSRVVVGGLTNGAGNLRIPRPRGRTAVARKCGFSDEGYLKYYYNNDNSPVEMRRRIRCGGVVEEEVKEKKKKVMKKRLKLLKGLLSMDHLDNNNNNTQGLVDQIKANMMSDATEVLLTQLGQQLKAEEKEMKRKKKEAKAIKKQEKKNKKKMLQCEESSSSSSSSSESECGEVVDMSRLKNQVLAPPRPPPSTVVNELQPEQQTSPIASQSQLTAGHGLVEELNSRVNVAIVEEQPLLVSSSGAVENKKKIEVCMGGKCKKSGAALLIEEFNKVLGASSNAAAAVGCKCMGKCKSAPNVRVVLNNDNTFSTSEEAQTQGGTPATKSICIGVGLDDVSTIVSSFLLQNQNTVNDGFAAAAAM